MFFSFVTLYFLRPKIFLQLGSDAQYIHGILCPEISIVRCVYVWGWGEVYFVGPFGRQDVVRKRTVDMKTFYYGADEKMRI